MVKKFGAVIVLIAAILFFYSPFIFSQRLPVPADTIVGLYNPFRDLYSQQYPNGIPYKNFLITDPVRQTYIWKELAVSTLKKGNLPLWNPYEMSGKPLIGNFQSSAFYPLNVLYFIFPFFLSWSLLIVLQSLLLGIFMYLYLRNLKLNLYSSLIGSLALTFSGFSIAWLEWGTIISTALWLPLILLSVDKLFVTKKKVQILWFFVLVLGYVCSFFAGHLQTFLYLYIVSLGYFVLRWFENKKSIHSSAIFVLASIVFIVVTFIQWFPTLQFILLSARSADQNYTTIEGWFIPWRHLIQFISPDFFGNPSTLNYWGTWNYGELVGYIGIIPLILSFYAFYKKNSTSLFFLSVTAFSLLLALPTGVSSIPFLLKIPLLSTAQPTRLLFPIVFSMSVLASFGFANLMEVRKMSLKKYLPFLIIGLVFSFLWVLILTKSQILFGSDSNAFIAKRNIIFPFVIFCIFSVLVTFLFKIRSGRVRIGLISIILFLTFVDLFRFAQKFTPFTDLSYLYPTTKSITFLKSQPGLFRIATLDRRIMPPNFFTHYKLQTIEGYDPLYLKSYAEYIAVMERNRPDVSTPFGFNRIITPHNFNSQLFDFLNVKYVLSLDEISYPKLVKVFQEGQTKIYENKNVLPRIFFVEKVVSGYDDINLIFQNDLSKTAIVNGFEQANQIFSVGLVTQVVYSENAISMRTENQEDGYLVMSDAYYPTWKAYIDGVGTKIYTTNHSFRGILVPKGKHTVQFKDNLF